MKAEDDEEAARSASASVAREDWDRAIMTGFDLCVCSGSEGCGLGWKGGMRQWT